MTANLILLVALVGLCVITRILGPPLVEYSDVPLYLLAIGAMAQFLLLAVAAHKREPSRLTTPIRASLWVAFIYPFLLADEQIGVPLLWAFLSVPVAFLLAYLGIWLMTHIIRVVTRRRSVFENTPKT